MNSGKMTYGVQQKIKKVVVICREKVSFHGYYVFSAVGEKN